MRTALITGISGQDGSFLTELLLGKGYNVVGICRSDQYLSNLSKVMDKINLVYGDVSDINLLIKLIKEYKPEEIYNFAAISDIASCWSNPYQSTMVNLVAPLQIIESIKNISPESKFIQATSREIFGNCPDVINENSPFSTENTYAAHKLAVHAMLSSYRKMYNLHLSSAILFNHESERRPVKFVTKKVAEYVKNVEKQKRKLELGNLDSLRDWGYAPDFVYGMWLMIQQTEPDDYLFCTEKMKSIRDLCDVAFKIKNLNYEEFVTVNPDFIRKNEVEAPTGTFKKAKDKLGWYPSTTFEDMIKKMVLN